MPPKWDMFSSLEMSHEICEVKWLSKVFSRTEWIRLVTKECRSFVCRDMSCKCVSGMSFQLDTRTVQKCSYAFKEETSLLLILFIFEPSFSYLHFFPPESFQCGTFFSATQIRNLTKVIFKTQQRFFRPGKFQAKPEVPMGGP